MFVCALAVAIAVTLCSDQRRLLGCDESLDTAFTALNATVTSGVLHAIERAKEVIHQM